MTDLTEYTWYYCKMKNGDIEMLERGSDYFLSGDVPLLNDEVKEVLTPVPSFEELQNMNEAVNQAIAANIKMLEKIDQLKELLKECELWFAGIIGNMNDKNFGEHNRNLPIGNFEYIFKVFSQKINEVLK